MPKSVISVLTLAALSGCAVTVSPDEIPVFGPTLSGCLSDLSPFDSLNLADVVRFDRLESEMAK